MRLRPDFIGLNGFLWWHGVVEDIEDPEKMGRLRVRVLGWHTDDKTSVGIPTEDLPWATVLMPITTSSMTGLGRSPTGILPGSWVIGFFLDGEAAQQPFVLGSYGGIQKPDIALGLTAVAGLDQVPYNDFKIKPKSLQNRIMNNKVGFRDPSGFYPIEGRMGEPDTNRLVRNENIDWTVVKKKRDEVLDCDTALYGYWQEPYTPYAAKYPYNHVVESQSGHIFEVDDTTGAERIHTYHRSGTFDEIHPNGSQVHKVVGNEWNITLNDRLILVRGNASWNTDRLMKIRVGKDLGKNGHFEIEVEGDMRVLVKGNTIMETQCNFLHKVKGKYTTSSEGNMLFVAPRIDLNPNGSSAQKIQTFLTKLRGTIRKVVRDTIDVVRFNGAMNRRRN
jgi:hypothetical protein